MIGPQKFFGGFRLAQATTTFARGKRGEVLARYGGATIFTHPVARNNQ
jgi:hypothetical protein